MYSSDVPSEVSIRIEAWRALSSEYGLSLAAVALAFAKLPGFDIVVGMRSASEVRQLLLWSKRQVPSALWREAMSRGLILEGIHPFIESLLLSTLV
jgi:aryl-alcohol dehydrogenase-like predicted oxidoreductase